VCVALATACGPSGTRILASDVDVDTGGPSGSGGRGGAAGAGATGGSGGRGFDTEPGTGGASVDAAVGDGGAGGGGTPGQGGQGGQGGIDAGIDARGGAGGGGVSGGDAAVDTSAPDTRPPAPPDAPVRDAAAEMPPVAPPGSSLTMGLISRWSLEEGTGTAAADSVGGNPGTLSGAVWVKPGFAEAKSKAAVHFDGSDDFVELGVKNLPANNRPQTVAFWFRTAAAPGGNAANIAVSLTNGTASGSRLKMGLHNGAVAAWKSGSDNLVATPAPAINVWHHYAYTFDGTTNLLYVDGVEKNRSTTAPDPGPVSNARMGSGHNNAENFGGDVDELRVYSRAITAAEVLALSKGDE
jgi:hypothetical protein